MLDEDVTYTFAAIPDRAPTIALTKEPEPQARGSLLLAYKIEDDYGVIGAQATFALKAARAQTARSRVRSTARRISRWCCRRRARATAPAQTTKDLSDHPVVRRRIVT